MNRDMFEPYDLVKYSVYKKKPNPLKFKLSTSYCIDFTVMNASS